MNAYKKIDLQIDSDWLSEQTQLSSEQCESFLKEIINRSGGTVR